MKFYLLFPILFSLLFFSLSAEAQQRRWNPKSRFKAAVLGGVTAAQMDGDNFTGYDKFGLQFGARGIVLLSRHLQLNVELLYSQKGARVEANPKILYPKKTRVLELNYAEVPILLRYSTKEEGKGTFLEGGFSFARLLGSAIQEDTSVIIHTFTAIQDDFKRNELSLIAGVGQQLTQHIGLGIRTTISLSYVIDQRDKFQEPITIGSYYSPGFGSEIKFLRNYFVSVYANYVF
jgi:hypothetical protein